MADNTCKPCNNNVFKTLSTSLSGNGEAIDIIGDDSIQVDTQIINDVKTFFLTYNPYTPLTIVNFSSDKGLQLKGNTVTDIDLSWTYNKAVTTQSLNSTFTAPAVLPGKTSYILEATGQSITSNTTIILTADDNTNDSIPPKTASTSIIFGNYIYQTQIAITDRQNINTTTINNLDLSILTKTLKTNRSLIFNASSIATEYETILIPTSFGLNSGTQFKDIATNFTGGWSKLLTLPLTNEAGFTESYDVFVASNKNLNGLTFQIT